jgi:alpha-1,3-rhamnosyl/mannosyltransferase
LEPRKNIDRLLQAYQQLPVATRKEYGLVLIGGGGWLNDQTLKLIDELVAEGLNIFHPKQYVEDADLPAIYSGATLLTHPAIYEGFGIPPIQAMACGVPVAASNIPSIAEVVGKSALLFDPYSVEDISRTLQRALDSESVRRDLSTQGKTQAAKFTWAHSAEILKDVIKEIRA